jgi:hypothetical protein
MAVGDYRGALDRAKELHKTLRTPASEALLVDAYIARIRALASRGLNVEAKALADLVRERHSSARKRLDELKSASRSSSLDDVVRPLADPDLPAEARAAVERTVQCEVWNLAALAACQALPPQHPLRVGAAALHGAFAAVTTGPVSDELLELPEVSRRSPLSSWKLLVRAIAYFYRDDRPSCERALAAIDPVSVAARLVPMLRSMLCDEPAGQSGGSMPAGAAVAFTEPAAALRTRVTGKPPLERELEALDRAFASRGRSGILKLVRSAMELCRRESPNRLESLEQHLSVRCAIADVPVERVVSALGGPSRHNATFHRLFARALEATKEPKRVVLACAVWDEFRRAAVEEGWFAENGVESAAVSLHIAELLEGFPDEDLRVLQRRIRADADHSGKSVAFLFPDELYRRACVLDPHREAFAQWMTWARRQPGAVATRAAKAWHAARPSDIEPILWLVDEAESKRAYATALALLAKLERIDGLRQDVQRRRVRVFVGSACDQVRRRKLALASRAIDQLAGMAVARSSEGLAVVAALRALVLAAAGDADGIARHRADVECHMDSHAGAALLLATIGAAARLRTLAAIPPAEKLSGDDRVRLPHIVARVARLANELGLKLDVPRAWMVVVQLQFDACRTAIEVRELRALTDVALHHRLMSLADRLSSEGLARGGPSEAEFLYVRARVCDASPDRAGICARAAAELAREQRDDDLVGRALALAEDCLGPMPLTLTLDQARAVLQREKAAAPLGDRRATEPDYRDLLPVCQCATCRMERGERIDPFDAAGFDDDEDVGIDAFDLPPGVAPELMAEVLDEARAAAARGESFDEFSARILGEAAPRRRRPKRRKRR